MKKLFCVGLTVAFAWGLTLSASAWTYDSASGVLTAGDWVLTTAPFNGSATELSVTGVSTVGGATLDLGGTDGAYSIVAIGTSAFEGNNKIANLILPETLRRIEGRAFYKCEALKNVTPFLPSSLTYLGGAAFAWCPSLEGELTIDPTEPFMWGYEWVSYGVQFGSGENDAVDGSKITKATLGRYVTTIPNRCFQRCKSLKTLDAQYVETIEYWAFQNCGSLEEVALGDSCARIENRAFYQCVSLGTVTPFLPASLTYFGGGAFCGCQSLTGELRINAQMGEDTGWGSPYSGIPFGCGDADVARATRFSKVTLGPDVTSVPSSCFRNCTDLRDVYFHGAPPTWGTQCFHGVSGALRFFIPRGADSPWAAFKADPAQMKPWAEVDDHVKTAYFEKFGSSAPTPIGVALNAQINGFYICAWRVPGTCLGFMLIVR